uniref:ABC transporter domain-containing protein n=1 Tax=Hyaloperonospora arabidopsidis (strain Emoy2) TaxID=559515 RepID=M4C1P6_HYAAE
MLVYEKSLTLSLQTKSSLGLPKLMDLVTVDIDRIFKLWSKIHSVWAAGIHLIIGFILLTQYIGSASLVSAVIMILLPMVKSALSSLMASTSTKLADCTNKRLTFLTDLCQYIRVVKFYAWESELLGQVDTLREEERRFQKKMVIWNACRSAIEQAGPVLVSFGTFAAYSYLESKPLTADKAFTAIALFSIIRPTLVTLPQVLPLICIATGSIKRVEAFLHLKQRERVPTALSSSFIDNPLFEIRHATFKWRDTEELPTGASDEGASLPQLLNVTISVPKGKLTLIFGGAGSGKSALLAAILGELQPEYGVVRFPSRYISYAAQMPYIIDASVQENVLFGAPLDTARLHRVVKCCELEKELVLLPNGFQSEIGKHGITLSDDQKQRLSIARALYPKEQELYVFDDPLSALDVHVATRIFHQCFSELTGGLLAGLTRIVSTHAVQFAHLADWIIVMDNMRVVEMGTYQDLTQVTADGKFTSMLRTYHPAEESVVEHAVIPDDPAEDVETIQFDPWSNSCVNMLPQDEEKSAGHVSWNVFLSYFVSCGTLSTVGAFALLFTKQVVSISTDFWLTKWTSNSAAGVDSVFYLTFYAYLGLSTISLGFVGELCCQYAGLR